MYVLKVIYVFVIMFSSEIKINVDMKQPRPNLLIFWSLIISCLIRLFFLFQEYLIILNF